MKNMIFARVAWSGYLALENTPDSEEVYISPRSTPQFAEDTLDGGDQFNFLETKLKPEAASKFYAYFHVQNQKPIDLSKVGTLKSAKVATGIAVVLFAKEPETGKQYIIGWYMDATIFNTIQSATDQYGNPLKYRLVSELQHGKLLKPQHRTFELVGPGVSNVWYGPTHKDDQQLITDYISQWMRR
jgi:hypothetical protein